MNKRGTEWATLYSLAEVLGVVAVVILYTQFAGEVSDNSVIHMKYFSREISMATLLAQSSPGPMMINYSPSIKVMDNFEYSWNEGVVGVSRLVGGPAKEYQFLWNKMLWDGKAKLAGPQRMFFTRNWDGFAVSGTPRELSMRFVCERSVFSPKKVFIDPGHGEDVLSPLSAEAEFACRVAEGLSRTLRNKEINASRPQDGLGLVLCTNTFRLPDEVILEKMAAAEIVLSIHSGDRFRAFIPANAGYTNASAIACRILNRIQDSFPDRGFAVIPIERPEGFLLSTDKPTIMFEIPMDIQPYSVYNAMAEVLNE
jgi:hypothetical protein